jgi:hypothetical protein
LDTAVIARGRSFNIQHIHSNTHIAELYIYGDQTWFMKKLTVQLQVCFKNKFLFRGDLGFPRGGCRTDKTRVWQKTAGLDGGREGGKTVHVVLEYVFIQKPVVESGGDGCKNAFSPCTTPYFAADSWIVHLKTT